MSSSALPRQKATCLSTSIFKAHVSPNFHRRILLVSLALFSSIGECQDLINLIEKGRCSMNVSQGIEQFFEYQRLNVKKKYIQEL
jgi:hypothetical protein